MLSYSWLLRRLDKVVKLLDIYIEWLDNLSKYMSSGLITSGNTCWVARQPLDMSSRSTMLLSCLTHMSSGSTTSQHRCRAARHPIRVARHWVLSRMADCLSLDATRHLSWAARHICQAIRFKSQQGCWVTRHICLANSTTLYKILSLDKSVELLNTYIEQTQQCCQSTRHICQANSTYMSSHSTCYQAI